MTDTTKADAPAPADDKYVRYIGTADVREIDVKDGWSNIDGATDKKKVWNRANGWKLPVSEFTDAALAYLHDVDPGFVVDQ